MGTPAAQCTHEGASSSAFHSTTARGLNERLTSHNRPSIRVIACSGGSNAHHPAHARAMLSAQQAGTLQNSTAQPYRSLAGVSFGLSQRERTKAVCAGALLALILLAAAVL